MSTISQLENELDRLERELKTLIQSSDLESSSDSNIESSSDGDLESNDDGIEGPYYDITIKDLTDDCKELLSAYGINLTPNFVIARLCSAVHR
jgi:hypothetical protein